MKKRASLRSAVSTGILGLSALCWAFLLTSPGKEMTGGNSYIPICGLDASFQISAETFPLSAMMKGWILMVFAMMLPKLIAPVQYIFERTFMHRRVAAALIFVSGYIVVWAVAGFLINLVVVAVSRLTPQSAIPALMAGIVAVIWQFSPAKQYFLNLGHNHSVLSAFGPATFRDAFQFGLLHGLWCVGSGWVLMLLPMLLPVGHNAAMMVAAFIMISEHMEHPRAPTWHFGFRLKLLRIIVAQSRIHFEKMKAALARPSPQPGR